MNLRIWEWEDRENLGFVLNRILGSKWWGGVICFPFKSDDSISATDLGS